VQSAIRNPHSAIGLTLLEVLVAIAIAGLFSTALYGFYRLHASVLKAEEIRISMQENSRLAIDFLIRELRVAGARPVRNGPCDGFERLTIADRRRVTIQYDFRGNSPNAPPDGCPDDPNERIAYTYESSDQILKRGTGSGAPQPFINDVPPGGFLLRYFDRDGSELAPPLDETGRALVHSMRVTVRTSKTSPDPRATEPIASELSSTIFLPNPPE